MTGGAEEICGLERLPCCTFTFDDQLCTREMEMLVQHRRWR